MVVVITHGGGEDFFGLILPDHKAVEVGFDVGGAVIELEDFADVGFGIFDGLFLAIRHGTTARTFDAGEEHLAA